MKVWGVRRGGQAITEARGMRIRKWYDRQKEINIIAKYEVVYSRYYNQGEGGDKGGWGVREHQTQLLAYLVKFPSSLLFMHTSHSCHPPKVVTLQLNILRCFEKPILCLIGSFYEQKTTTMM